MWGKGEDAEPSSALVFKFIQDDLKLGEDRGFGCFDVSHVGHCSDCTSGKGNNSVLMEGAEQFSTQQGLTWEQGAQSPSGLLTRKDAAGTATSLRSPQQHIPCLNPRSTQLQCSASTPPCLTCFPPALQPGKCLLYRKRELEQITQRQHFALLILSHRSHRKPCCKSRHGPDPNLTCYMYLPQKLDFCTGKPNTRPRGRMSIAVSSMHTHNKINGNECHCDRPGAKCLCLVGPVG